MDAERLIMPENLPVERLVREALCAERAKRAAGYRQLAHSRGAERRANDRDHTPETCEALTLKNHET